MEIAKDLENRLRQRLAIEGFALHKSTAAPSVDNMGGYMIVDPGTDTVFAGSRYNLTLDDVEGFVKGLDILLGEAEE